MRAEDPGGVPPPSSRVYPLPGVHHSMEMIGMTFSRKRDHVVTVFTDREKRIAAVYPDPRAGPEAHRHVVSLLEPAREARKLAQCPLSGTTDKTPPLYPI